MIEWIKRHKVLFVVVIILLVLLIAFGLFYALYLRPKWQAEEAARQEFVQVQAPPQQVEASRSPLPVGTSQVNPSAIARIPRPAITKTSDRDHGKQDLRNPGIVADMQARASDGGMMPPPPSGGGASAGDIEDLFSGDGLPQDTEYPQVLV